VLSNNSFLGAFVEPRRATISCQSVRPSVCPLAWNKSAPTRRIFVKFDMCIFRKSVAKIKISLKSDKNNGYLTRRRMYVYNITLNSSQNEKCVRQKLYIKSKHTFYVQ